MNEATARKYRPQRLSEVLGQDAIVTTLINALKQERVAHALLFSGPRGTGKTSIARILAKSLNCEQDEPCNTCSSCKEIAHGSSLNVLEIDGASHRGIDDIRQINETVAYAPSTGHTKIYIIDEVHMLTKEAFNALLKTLEEPPENVKFFFATTEPHKVPATIISRCQHFQLNGLSNELIASKLKHEAEDMKIKIDQGALDLIAQAAEGGMRDAESILDQVISFHKDDINEEIVAEILGLAPRSIFFKLDKAAEQGDLKVPFAIAEELMTKGKNLAHFVTNLIEHYRNLLLCHLDPNPEYQESAKIYSKEALLHLLDDLIETQNRLKSLPSKRVAIEMMLTRVVRSNKRIPIETVVQRLLDLEGRMTTTQKAAAAPKPAAPTPQPVAPPPAEKKPQNKPKEALRNSGGSDCAESGTPERSECEAHTLSSRAEHSSRSGAPEGAQDESARISKGLPKSHYDTVLRFAAVELEGRVEK